MKIWISKFFPDLNFFWGYGRFFRKNGGIELKDLTRLFSDTGPSEELFRIIPWRTLELTFGIKQSNFQLIG